MATPPRSVDVEMADAANADAAAAAPASSSSTLSSPPFSGSEYEDIEDEEVPNQQQITSLKNISLSSPVTAGIDLANMTRRSARNTNKPKPVLVVSPTRPAKRKIVTKVAAAKKAPKWTPEKLLTDTKSPLASADLRTILCQPSAWDVLTKDERAEIIALFPEGTRIINEGTDDARPDFDALRNDNNFRHDCATYTDNIAQGKHDPEWLEQAWAARERRRAGDFDAYLVQKFEDEWSCELPESFKPKRGHGGEEAAAASSSSAGEGNEATEESGKEVKEVQDGVEVAVDGAAPCKDVEMRVDGEAPAASGLVVKLGSPAPETQEKAGTNAEAKMGACQNPSLANGHETANGQAGQETLEQKNLEQKA